VDANWENAAECDRSEQLYKWAVVLVRRERKARLSFLQLQLQIGFNEALRIVERMEREGVISRASGSPVLDS
jgi:S-DNA-T family DNA segregation ATPase FtsK/SpoIIIE